MKLRKNLAAVIAAIMLFTVAIPAYASSELDSGSWYSWFFSLFESDASSNANASGLGKPPPR